MDKPVREPHPTLSFHAGLDAAPVEWRVEPGLTDYARALEFMEQRAAAIREGRAPEMVWLVEHPPLYTAGTSAKREDLLDGSRFPVHAAGRGGEYTYHGPGQRVAYIMLDLKRRREDVRAFVLALEDWIIGALARFNVLAVSGRAVEAAGTGEAVRAPIPTPRLPGDPMPDFALRHPYPNPFN